MFAKRSCRQQSLFQYKGKGVELYIALCVHASNALSVTKQSRRPHGHHVQPADTAVLSTRRKNG